MIKYSKKWWLDVADRCWRQARQAAVPVLAVVATGNAAGVDSLASAGIGVVAAAVVTVARAVTGARVPDTASPAVQVADRAVSSVVGVAVGLLVTVFQAAAGGSWPGVVDAVQRLDGSSFLYAILGAGVLAVIDARSVPTLVDSPDEALPAVAFP